LAKSPAGFRDGFIHELAEARPGDFVAAFGDPGHGEFDREEDAEWAKMAKIGQAAGTSQIGVLLRQYR
jgi:hypothetical protein